MKFWNKTDLFYILLSSALLSIAWYPFFTWCIFFALVPYLLYLEKINKKSWWVFGLHTFLWLFFWNIGVLWWLYYIGFIGSFMAWWLHAVFHSLALLIFYFLYALSKEKKILLFIFCWVGFEFLDIYWDFSWIWLQLGNVLGNQPHWVQWYEYTGVFGGTLWILITNYLLYKLYKEKKRKHLILSALFIILPITLSYGIYYLLPQDTPTNKKVILVQPNIDTYTQKYIYNALTDGENTHTHIPMDKQIEKLVSLSNQSLSQDVALIVWPETAIHEYVLIDYYASDTKIKNLTQWMREEKKSLLFGASTYQLYPHKKTETARLLGENQYYDVFNTALFLSKDTILPYHKSQLVIGVETLPYPSILGIFSQNLGGTTGTLARQKERSVFTLDDSITIGPIICYESIYGEFVTEYVEKKAQLLCVITNDDWWGDTPGHRQHLRFSQLRAIENRKPVIRAANTGVSAFIDSKGDIIKRLDYRKEGIIKQEITTNDTVTFYTKYGDYIARITIFLLIMTVISIFFKKMQKK